MKTTAQKSLKLGTEPSTLNNRDSTDCITLSLYSRSPRNPEQKIIKRVIALEGDIIKTMDYRNQYVKIPPGHIWVEGDHHGRSFDSNAFGPVSLGLLHAHATHILWPPQRWQRLESILPPERGPIPSEEI
ncbi:mitochondrial inner membrane protease subunit 2 [Trichosurus vulpecula]|uniref:mitochondrial inner membrane protease subunit 2 n=1 Tax=Trichosurus vulpecula TaxID=9337 RepID=UPI00186B2E65|nr:mitochondrial inner membrane protease subunit 2 [Trichosurus vulpecula]